MQADAERIAEAAYRQAQLGEFAGAEQVIAEPAHADAPARAWHAALRAIHWLAAPELGSAPGVAEIGEMVRGPAAAIRAATLVCEQMELGARLAFDAAAHAEWMRVHESLAGLAAGDPA